MVAKSFPRKRFARKRILEKLFWSKICYSCKIISSKTDLQGKNSSKIFLVENFLWFQNHFLDNRFASKKFFKNFFGRKFFMVAKSFPRKQICKKKISWKIFNVENVLWLQNHFLENRFARKKFLNIFFGRKFLRLQNHFLENRFARKKFLKNFFGRKFFMVAKSFPRKQICKKKISWKIFNVENVLWLQNHFLENRFARKKFLKIFWSIIFYGCKIISSKTDLQGKKFLKNFFGRKCFMVAK